MKPCHRADEIAISRVAGQVEQVILDEIPGKVNADGQPQAAGKNKGCSEHDARLDGDEDVDIDDVAVFAAKRIRRHHIGELDRNRPA